MGNLSNLYISQSYQSLIHLGNDSTVQSSLVGLQDGLGNPIGVAVNATGDLSISGSFTSSLQSGYALVGGVGNKTTAVPTSSFGGGGDTTALNQFTASQETKNTTLGTYTGSVDTKFTTIGTQSGSWINTSLNTFTASQETKNNTLGAYTQSVDTKFSTIGTQSGSWENVPLTSLNAFTASQDTKNTTLGSVTASLQGQLTNIGSQSGSWVNTSLNAFTASQIILNNQFATTGSNTFNGSQNIVGTLTASLQLGYALVGGAGNVTTAVPTSSFGGGGSSDLGPLNTFTASQETKNSTLATYTGSIDTKFTTLGTQSGSWITNSQTSSMSVNFAVTSSKAQDLYVNAKNTTSAIITKGSVVRITGATGDNPEIGLADWTDDANSANTLGVAADDIAVNGFADIIVQGRVIGLNTNAFTAGQLIFLGPSGSIVASVPTPYHEVRLGQVLRANINNGSIYLSIDNGYELSELHDVNIVTSSLANNNLLAYDSASLQWTNKSISTLGIPQLGTNNTFTGTLNQFQNISAVTASFQYLQSVTGSAKIIGDAFIVLNNDTPTERYAGIIVVDSGSTNTTASFQFDGQSNDWFYEYTGSDPLNFGVALFGPEYATKGSPIYNANNRIVKGMGGHHIVDSNISDDGSNVSINSNTQITGSLLVNGNAPLINSNLAPLNTFTQSVNEKFTTLGGQSGSWNQAYNSTLALNTYTQSNDSKWNTLGAFTASQQVLNATYATTGSNSFTGTQSITQSGGNGLVLTNSGISVAGAITASNGINVLNGSGIDLKANIEGSGSAYASISTTVDVTSDPTNVYSALQLIKPGGETLIAIAANSYTAEYPGVTIPYLFGGGNNTGGTNAGIAFPTNGNMDVWKTTNFAYGVNITGSALVNGSSIVTANQTGSLVNVPLTSLNSFTASQDTKNSTLATYTGSIDTKNNTLATYTGSVDTKFATIGGQSGSWINTALNTFTASQETKDSTLATYTGSVDTKFATIGGQSGSWENIPLTSLNAFTASQQVLNATYATTGSNIFNGNQTITGSLILSSSAVIELNVIGNSTFTGSFSVSGSINTSVIPLTITSNTASLNASSGSTFQLNLVSGSATRLEVTNTLSGQTINLLVSQSATGPGTLLFGTNIEQPSGSFYSASQVASGEDIITMATFINPNRLYLANIKNFI